MLSITFSLYSWILYSPKLGFLSFVGRPRNAVFSGMGFGMNFADMSYTVSLSDWSSTVNVISQQNGQGRSASHPPFCRQKNIDIYSPFPEKQII